ncbi:MAG: D-sedoheptulose 7-phosphate isomerase [Chitinophagaceae bacterium]
MDDKIQSLIRASINVKQGLLQDEEITKTLRYVVDITVNALQQGHRLWFCGNGGSAADAQHLAAEFTGRFYKNRRALPAEAFHCNTSYLTAVANDYSYDEVYSRMVEGVCEEGDILFGFSTSGNSANIINAFRSAKAKGVITVGMTGDTGGALKALSDYLLPVPSADTPRIQESHILLGHIICQLTEEEFFRQ